MKEFSALRAKARENRDRVINLTRAEYAQRMAEIDSLEMSLKGPRKRDRAVRASVSAAIPSDREFTQADVMAVLEAMDPSRIWTTKSVEHSLFRMRHKGLIRRVSRHGNGRPAVYVRVDVPTRKRAFEDMTLVEVMAAVLADRAMTQTELVVAMLEAGYETTMSRKALRMEVTTILRKGTGRFKTDGDKWRKLSG